MAADLPINLRIFLMDFIVKRGIRFGPYKRQINEEALLVLRQVTDLAEVEVTLENISAECIYNLT